jgi:hypothetical protein
MAHTPISPGPICWNEIANQPRSRFELEGLDAKDDLAPDLKELLGGYQLGYPAHG